MRPEPPIRQKHSLGQVFLHTDWPVERVIEKLKRWRVQRVFEIGMGNGILTKGLIDAGFRVTAIDKDERFVDRLRDYARHRNRAQNASSAAADEPEANAIGSATNDNIEIVHADVLRYDLKAWCDRSQERAAVVGNIPYYISSPILQWVMPWLPRLIGVQFMVQFEFAMRLVAKPSSKDYGSLTVYTQLRSNPELVCKVDRTCFTPIPKVDSALLSLQHKADRLPDDVLVKVELLTRSAFIQRRKTLRNSIRQHMEQSEVTTPCIDLGRRADSLWPDEFVALAKQVFRI